MRERYEIWMQRGIGIQLDKSNFSGAIGDDNLRERGIK